LLDRPPTPAQLTARALKASSPEERQQAVLRLINIKGGEILPYLRTIITESQDPEVVLTALNGMSAFVDPESLPILIDKMDNPDKAVREQAAYVVLKIFGGEKLPEGIEYDPEGDDTEARRKVVRRLHEVLADRKRLEEKAAQEKEKQDQKK